MNNNTERARALYGSGWLDLPMLAQQEAADFVSDLLNLDAGSIVSGEAYDVCWQAADTACPIYYHEQLGLLTSEEVWGWVMDTSEGNFETPQEGEDLYHYTCRAAAVQYVQALSALFGAMVDGLSRPEGWVGLGLDDYDTADLAATLLPEWSGTVAELLEAAPRLAAEAVTA